MPRKSNELRRSELETALVDYVLEHGIGDVSLRPLAEALDTSTYTLIYYFGSKDAVLSTALKAINSHLSELFSEWATSRSPGELLRKYWEWTSSDDNRGQLTLFLEVYMQSIRRPDRFPGFLEDASVQTWVTVVTDLVERQTNLPRNEVERVATVLVAFVAGLQLDLVASHDIARTSEAVETTALMLDSFVERLISESDRHPAKPSTN
jgi:AcrR family transcriptional regulator